MIRKGSTFLVWGVISCLKELFKSFQSLYFSNLSNTLLIFKEIQHNLNTQNGMSIKSTRYKVAEDMLSLFNTMFTLENIDIYDVLVDPLVIKEVLLTLEVIIIQTNKCEWAFTKWKPSKLLFEEKSIFEFYETLCIEMKNKPGS